MYCVFKIIKEASQWEKMNRYFEEFLQFKGNNCRSDYQQSLYIYM